MSRTQKLSLWALCAINTFLFAMGSAAPAAAAEEVPVNGQCNLCIGEGGEAVWCCVKRDCTQVSCDCAWASNCA